MNTNKHSFSDDDYKHSGISSSSSIPIDQKPFESSALRPSNNPLNIDNKCLQSAKMETIDLEYSSLKASEIIDSFISYLLGISFRLSLAIANIIVKRYCSQQILFIMIGTNLLIFAGKPWNKGK